MKNKKKPYYTQLREKVGKQKLLLPAVAVFIENEKEEMLLVRKHGASMWVFPGGYVELDESIEQTARREVLEETGYKIKVGKIIGVYSGKGLTKIYSNGDIVQPLIIFVQAFIQSGGKRTDEEEIVEVKYFPVNKPPVLEKCCKKKYLMLKDFKAG